MAFKQKYNIESVRLPATDYFKISSYLTWKLEKFFEKVVLIPAFTDKKDFGDADLLVANPRENHEPVTIQLQKIFNLDENEIIQNSNIYSCLIQKFQVDVILTNSKFFYSSLDYFSFSPLGNLMGKLAHKFSARLGFDGLSYMLRDDQNVYKLGTLAVSQDYEKICKFLKLDWVSRKRGFTTEQQIFDWIINSEYFDARIFAYENMTHIAKVRDRKRPDYARFLKYIEKFKNKVYDFPLKSDAVKLLNEFFPESNLIGQIQELKDKEIKRKENAAKFNGDLVRDWCPGLEGKELGKVLSEFKFHRGACSDARTFEDYLQMYPAEKIKSDFFAWIKEFKVYSMSEINS